MFQTYQDILSTYTILNRYIHVIQIFKEVFFQHIQFLTDIFMYIHVIQIFLKVFGTPVTSNKFETERYQ